MTFTYAGTLVTNLDKVRFYIGDTVSGGGPLPSSGNFTDEELGALITLAGGVDEGVAQAFDAIAARWSVMANLTVGPRREEMGQIAAAFRAQAETWRKDHAVHSTSTAGARWITRSDGYSQDIDAGET